MSESSWMMAGGRMKTTLDGGQGQAIGSRISMTGRVLGIDLEVEEVVTERNPPHRKVWETIGAPRLLVIDHYRMGFEISPDGENSMLRAFIEYALPPKTPGSWLGGSSRLIVRQFATEAVAIGLAGGTLGWLFGLGMAQVIGHQVFHTAIAVRADVPPIVVGLAVLVAVVSSIGPARIALRVEPAQALKGD